MTFKKTFIHPPVTTKNVLELVVSDQIEEADTSHVTISHALKLVLDDK